jgi:hypothetical protein
LDQFNELRKCDDVADAFLMAFVERELSFDWSHLIGSFVWTSSQGLSHANFWTCDKPVTLILAF